MIKIFGYIVSALFGLGGLAKLFIPALADNNVARGLGFDLPSWIVLFLIAGLSLLATDSGPGQTAFFDKIGKLKSLLPTNSAIPPMGSPPLPGQTIPPPGGSPLDPGEGPSGHWEVPK